MDQALPGGPFPWDLEVGVGGELPGMFLKTNVSLVDQTLLER